VRRRVASNHDNSEDTPITTGHSDFNQRFWFASTAACDGKKEVHRVVCINLSKNQYERKLLELIDRINNGWLPEE
jgi:hypothetical protein